MCNECIQKNSPIFSRENFLKFERSDLIFRFSVFGCARFPCGTQLLAYPPRFSHYVLCPLSLFLPLMSLFTYALYAFFVPCALYVSICFIVLCPYMPFNNSTLYISLGKRFYIIYFYVYRKKGLKKLREFRTRSIRPYMAYMALFYGPPPFVNLFLYYNYIIPYII